MDPGPRSAVCCGQGPFGRPSCPSACRNSHARPNLCQLRGRVPCMYHRLRKLARSGRPRGTGSCRGEIALHRSLPVEHPLVPVGDRGAEAPVGVFDPGLRAGHGDLSRLCGGMHGGAGGLGLCQSLPARRRRMPRDRRHGEGEHAAAGTVKTVAAVYARRVGGVEFCRGGL